MGFAPGSPTNQHQTNRQKRERGERGEREGRERERPAIAQTCVSGKERGEVDSSPGRLLWFSRAVIRHGSGERELVEILIRMICLGSMGGESLSFRCRILEKISRGWWAGLAPSCRWREGACLCLQGTADTKPWKVARKVSDAPASVGMRA